MASDGYKVQVRPLKLLVQVGKEEGEGRVWCDNFFSSGPEAMASKFLDFLIGKLHSTNFCLDYERSLRMYA